MSLGCGMHTLFSLCKLSMEWTTPIFEDTCEPEFAWSHRALIALELMWVFLQAGNAAL